MTEVANHNHILPPRAAGRRMTVLVPRVSPDETIGDIEKLLLSKTKEYETINYVYVVKADGVLEGVVSVKDLFRLPKETKVRSAMKTDLITARPHSHQEKVALLAVKNSLKAIPLVDKDKKLLGVVPADTINLILHEEHIDDLMHSAGVERFDNPAKDLLNASAGVHIKKRMPWLLLGLLGGVAAAAIVSRFEAVLSAHVLLAAFIPAVVYMADAVGTQTQTIFIRSLALDRSLPLARYAWRETRIGLALAVLFGLAIGVVSFLLWGSAPLALIFALSFFLTIVLAMVVAMLLPLLLDKTGIDPAVGSGPFATVVRDILSLLVYFGVAQMLLGILNVTTL